MGRTSVATWISALVVLAGGCRRDAPVPEARGEKASAATPSQPGAQVPQDCGHAVCADNFFVDAEPGGRCAVGSTCTVRVKLVATGNFHVNEQYPYKFKADDTMGVQFLGKDEGARNVFSKAAGDWHPLDARSGAMTVTFSALPAQAAAGEVRIGGVLKLSVCSGDVCQLEQSRVTVPIAVN
jgi:hypothetical protein